MKLLILKLALRILKARLRRIEIELWGQQLSSVERRDIERFREAIWYLEAVTGK